MDLVHRLDGVAQLFADAHGQLEAGVGTCGTDVQQQVARCGGGSVLGALEGLHGVQPLGPGMIGEEAGPGVVADADHAAEGGAGQAQVQGAQHGGHFTQGVARGVGGFVAVGQGQHDEDGGHTGRLHDRLRVGGGAGGLNVFVHGKDAFRRDGETGPATWRGGAADGSWQRAACPTHRGALMGDREGAGRKDCMEEIL